MSERTLSSLEYYDELRKTAANVERPSGSNVDVYHQQDNVVVHCHMSYFTFFTTSLFYDSLVAAARAMNDLNSGNGTFVPAVEGLNERCPIRFSMEVSDTGFSSGQALCVNNIMLFHSSACYSPFLNQYLLITPSHVLIFFALSISISNNLKKIQIKCH